MTAATPSLSHLSPSDYERVYEPAEDSFLLMDALEMDMDFLKAEKPLCCLEIGSGSGAVITFLASLLPFPTFSWSVTTFVCLSITVLVYSRAVDINSHACQCTLQTLMRNNISKCDVLTTDLANGFRERITGKIDVLLFNPPYVVTSSEEVGNCGIEASWAGGRNGREVIDRFLPSVTTLLSCSGVFYLVLLAQNRPSEVCEVLSRDGLQFHLVTSRSAGNEKLYVYKFYHPRTS